MEREGGRSGAATAGPRAAGAARSLLLSAVASGRLQDLAFPASNGPKPAENETGDVEMDEGDGMERSAAPGDALTLLLPLLVRLQHSSRSRRASGPSRRRNDAVAAAVDAMLLQEEEANALREYAAVFARLEAADVEKFRVQQLQQRPAAPLYRQFESGAPEQRACLVLNELMAFASASSASTASNELFMNEIYRAELAGILVLLLATPRLNCHPMFSRQVVVKFCLAVPLGAELIAILVENDPSSAEEVLDVVVQSLQQMTAGKSMVQQEIEALALTTELPSSVVAVQDACVAIARQSPLYAAMARDKLRSTRSLWAVAVVLHIITVSPVSPSTSEFASGRLCEDSTVFLLNWTRTPASPLLTFFRIACSRRSSDDKAKSSPPPPFQQVAEHLLELIKDQLLDDLDGASSQDASISVVTPQEICSTLGVWISLLSMSTFRLTDHEAMRVVRSLEKLVKTPSASQPKSRVLSLVFVIVLLVCYSLAPVLSKIPSQRDESTKAVASLAQHCVVAVYNSASSVRPLLIVSAVLLYTKSPALLPLLGAVVGDSHYFDTTSSGFRAEYLHVVGDVVLKSVLTENLMARDILTTPLPLSVSAIDRDQLRDLPLRAMHGLLSEKSFLRFHHGRQLESWMAQVIGGADAISPTQACAGLALPVHPLLLNVLFEWVDNYVMSFEYPISQSPTLQLAIVPLRPALVYRWLSVPCLHRPFLPSMMSEEERTMWARALLVLTYSLLFNQRVRHAMEVPGSKLSALSGSMSSNGNGAAPQVMPSNDIVLHYELDEMPLRNLLQQAMLFGEAGQPFEFVAPSLHRLMVDEYPDRVVIPVLSKRVGEQDAAVAWFRRRRDRFNRKSIYSLDGKVMWVLATLKVTELRDAPKHIIRREFEWLAASLLPKAVLMLQEEDDALSLCRAIVDLYVTSVRPGDDQECCNSDPSVIVRIVHALCYSDWTAKQFAQQEQLLQDGRAKFLTAVPLVVTYQQILEAPFRIIQDAERAIWTCPPLLELLLLVVRDVREASNAQLLKCDPTVGLARVSIAQQQAPPAAQQLPDAMSARAASVRQHQLVQDCVLLHALLKELAGNAVDVNDADGNNPESYEVMQMLCAFVDELFRGDATTSDPSQPPRLLVAVHAQGYDPRLVPWLVDRVPSLQLLWAFWMQSAGSSSRPPAGASSSSSGNSSSSKPLMEFLSCALDKNAPRAAFRFSVFFSLCAKYMTTRDLAAVTPATKLIWNKLRSATNAALNATTVPTHVLAKKKPAELFARVDGAFLRALLPLAARACSRHPDLSAELVQLLLKLQKMLPSPSSSGDTSPTDDGRSESTASALEGALHDAYRTLLQQLGA